MELYKRLQTLLLNNKKHANELLSTQLNTKISNALSMCELCHNETVVHSLLCQHCFDDLPLFTYQNLANNLLNWPAINALFPKRSFDQLLCLSPYIWPVDQWLKQYKYQHRFELANLFAFLLQPLLQELM